jgi:hypothetical protein
MKNKRYCDACQRLFRGESREAEGSQFRTRYFYHHLDAAEFADALRQQCPVCALAWDEVSHSSMVAGRYPGSTFVYIWKLPKRSTLTTWTEEGCWRLRFRHVPAEGAGMSDSHSRFLVLFPMSSTAASSRILSLSNHTGSSAAFDFLIEQYRECRSSHTKCQKQQPISTPTFYPTRLLNVGTECDNKIVLQETEHFSNGQQYACLSHCWGRNMPMTLRNCNKSDLEAGVAIDTLPLTFQHTVQVTRRLGFQFLWIDAL